MEFSHFHKFQPLFPPKHLLSGFYQPRYTADASNNRTLLIKLGI